MQELIDYFNERPEYDKTSEGYEIIQKAIELIEIEKEQIIIAYIHNRYVLAGGHPIRRDYAENYYNQTYNQNK